MLEHADAAAVSAGRAALELLSHACESVGPRTLLISMPNTADREIACFEIRSTGKPYDLAIQIARALRKCNSREYDATIDCEIDVFLMC